MSSGPSDIATIALDIDRLMRRIHAQLQLTAPDFDTHNVGPLGGMALLTIADNEPVDVQTVSDALGRDKSQISRLLKRLESQGLIEREKSVSDGRTTLLSLTVEGRCQLNSIKEALTSIIGTILESLSSSERKAFGSALSKIAALRVD
ncbi:MAG: MarR family transcriptional regulator [Pseudomonadota bacterium]